MSEERGSRSATVIAAGILISRVVGLVRNLLVASFFSLTDVADSYNAAFKIPNMLRNLLGEGTLSASFVPIYSQMLEIEDKETSRALARAVLGILMLIVSALTLAGIFFAPLLTTLLTPFFEGEKRELTIRLTRILFPMTAVMVLSGWCLGVQNSHRRFFWSYASAAMWSLSQIILLAGWGKQANNLSQLAVWLAWATLAGAFLQVAVQLPEVYRLIGPIRPTLEHRAQGVKSVLKNVVPVMMALGVSQVSAIVDLQIASKFQGGVTSLLNANTVAMLPVALFGVSIAASALPELSRDSGCTRYDALLERLRAGWQRILFYIIPSAAVFMALGDYVIGILYRLGQFGAAEQNTVHWVLAGYAVGLVSFGSVKLMASAYFALQDYRTPLRASTLSIVVSGVGAVAFAYLLRNSSFAAAGIAFGAALGSYVNLTVLLRGLRQRLGPLYTREMWIGTGRIVLATLIAVAVGLGMSFLQRSMFPGAHPRIAGPPILLAFAVTYLVVAWLRGSHEAARWLRLRPRAPRAGE